MKLIIDIGNSFAKVAVFDNNEIIDFQINEKVDIKLLRKVFQKFPQINSSILSSVAQHDLQLVDLMAQNGFFVELNHSTPVPFINKYRTPETLGKDRIAIV